MQSTSLGFTDEPFPAGTHMCYIYNDDEELRSAIAKYVESGLARGEKVTYLVDTKSPAELVAELESRGISTREADRGLIVAPAHEVYCNGGTFVPDQMLDVIRHAHASSLDDGFAGARGTGEMSWALRGIPGTEHLIEFESRVNSLMKAFPVTVICQYDARRFDGATLFDVLNVHPMMIVRGRVVRNPYYKVPSDLAEDSSVAAS